MKKLLIITLGFILAGCEKEDINPTLETEWYLTNVSGGIAGVNYHFTPGTITWTLGAETLVVVNNNTDETKFDSYESGQYTYQIVEDGIGEKLVIDNASLGYLDLQFDSLTVDPNKGGAADGFVLTFSN